MILVTGADGFVGRHLVARLLALGHPVRVLLSPARAARVGWGDADGQAPQVVSGTILDEETLFRACSGVHVVIHLENVQWWGRERDFERLELAGARRLITATRAARVGRLIILSHLGASASAGFPLLRYKGLVEDAVKTSGLAYTIVRSGVLFGHDDAFINHLALQLSVTPGVFLMPGRGEVVLHPLHVEDLVSALVASLDTLDSVDAVIEIGGAEYITVRDLVRTVMRVSGVHRVIVGVPPYVIRALLFVFTRVQRRSLVTPQWLDMLAANRTAAIGNLYRYFGVHPRRLEDTLLGYMRDRRYGFWSALRYTLRRKPRIV